MGESSVSLGNFAHQWFLLQGSLIYDSRRGRNLPKKARQMVVLKSALQAFDYELLGDRKIVIPKPQEDNLPEDVSDVEKVGK